MIRGRILGQNQDTIALLILVENLFAHFFKYKCLLTMPTAIARPQLERFLEKLGEQHIFGLFRLGQAQYPILNWLWSGLNLAQGLMILWNKVISGSFYDFSKGLLIDRMLVTMKASFGRIETIGIKPARAHPLGAHWLIWYKCMRHWLPHCYFALGFLNAGLQQL